MASARNKRPSLRAHCGLCLARRCCGRIPARAHAEPRSHRRRPPSTRANPMARINAPRSYISTASRSSKSATAISRARPSNRLIARYPASAAAADARKELGELYRADSDHASADSYDGRPRWPLRHPPPPARSRRPVCRTSRACPSCNRRAAHSGTWSCAATRRSSPSFDSRRAIASSSVRAVPSSAVVPARRSPHRRMVEALARVRGGDRRPCRRAGHRSGKRRPVGAARRGRTPAADRGRCRAEPSRCRPLGRSVRVAMCADTDCRAQNRRAVTLVFATGTRERLGLVHGATRVPPRSVAPPPGCPQPWIYPLPRCRWA